MDQDFCAPGVVTFCRERSIEIMDEVELSKVSGQDSEKLAGRLLRQDGVPFSTALVWMKCHRSLHFVPSKYTTSSSQTGPTVAPEIIRGEES
jgi:hypothetical protein